MSPVKLGPASNPLRDPDDRRLNRIAGPSSLIIFGVTGDLSRKKLMPAVYDLANRGLLPPGFALVGFARRDWADQDFGQVVKEAVQQYARTPWSEEVWAQLSSGIRFVSGEFTDDSAFDRLKQTIEDLKNQTTPVTQEQLDALFADVSGIAQQLSLIDAQTPGPLV